MKTLEGRRHSLTKKGPERSRGSLLSAEGVQRARRLGDALPAVEYVLTGPDRRHVETAIAMGFGVDEMVDWPSGYVAGIVDHHDQWRWEQPFVRYVELIGINAALQQVVNEHLNHWRRAVDQVDDGEAALVVSSGGSIEPVLVAAFAGGDHGRWGPALQHLQGATLTFDRGECVGVTIRRS